MRDLKPSKIDGDTSHTLCPPAVASNADDYGGIALEEFEQVDQTDNDKRYGDLVQNVDWEDVGEPGW